MRTKRNMFKRWKKYNPAWLVEASEYRFNEYPWLHEALNECTKAKEESDYYVYFVDGKNPNKPKSEWQFQENITIEDSVEGDIVIDVIKENRIGGIEFLTRVINDA